MASQRGPDLVSHGDSQILRFGHTGVAFETRLASYSSPNRTLAPGDLSKIGRGVGKVGRQVARIDRYTGRQTLVLFVGCFLSLWPYEKAFLGNSLVGLSNSK